jgi:hypothetical protein
MERPAADKPYYWLFCWHRLRCRPLCVENMKFE